METSNLLQTEIKNYITNFHIRNGIHIILQLFCIFIFGYYFFTKDWQTEIETTIKSIKINSI